MTNNSLVFKYSILILLTLVCIITFFFLAPISQPINYHQFADTRSWLQIPNFSNVVSNIFFLWLGIAGMLLSRNISQAFERKAYFVFFLGVLGTALGSSYFHWRPNNDTLFWDRLPITVAMMSFLAALIAERINLKLAKIIWLPLIAYGIISVIYWYITQTQGHGDLRPYLFTQTYPALFITATLLCHRNKDLWLWLAIMTYVIARVAEHFDHEIYQLSSLLISGHTIKHLLLALSILFIYLYITAHKIQGYRKI